MGKRIPKLREAPIAIASRYVETLRNHLYLQHWKFHIEEVGYEDRRDPGLESSEDSEALADIEPMRTRHVATLRLFPGYFRQDAEGKRHVITHELLHIKFADLQFAGRDYVGVTDLISYGHLDRAFMTALERTIDDMAVIVAPSLPLPD